MSRKGNISDLIIFTFSGMAKLGLISMITGLAIPAKWEKINEICFRKLYD